MALLIPTNANNNLQEKGILPFLDEIRNGCVLPKDTKLPRFYWQKKETLRQLGQDAANDSLHSRLPNKGQWLAVISNGKGGFLNTMFPIQVHRSRRSAVDQTQVTCEIFSAQHRSWLTEPRAAISTLTGVQTDKPWSRCIYVVAFSMIQGMPITTAETTHVNGHRVQVQLGGQSLEDLLYAIGLTPKRGASIKARRRSRSKRVNSDDGIGGKRMRTDAGASVYVGQLESIPVASSGTESEEEDGDDFYHLSDSGGEGEEWAYAGYPVRKRSDSLASVASTHVSSGDDDEEPEETAPATLDGVLLRGVETTAKGLVEKNRKLQGQTRLRCANGERDAARGERDKMRARVIELEGVVKAEEERKQSLLVRMESERVAAAEIWAASKSEFEKMKSEIEGKKKDEGKKDERIHELERKLAIMEKERLGATETIAASKREIEKMRSKMEGKEEDVGKKNKRISDLEHQLSLQKDHYTKDKEEITAQLNNQRTERGRAENEWRKVKEENERLKGACARERLLREREKDELNRKMEAEMEKLNRQMEAVTEALNRVSSVHEDNVQEIDRLKVSLTESEKSANMAKERADVLEKINSSLIETHKREIEMTQQRVKQLHEELAREQGRVVRAKHGEKKARMELERLRESSL